MFYDNFRCYSIVGRDGGRQDISLGYGCRTKGIAIHELLHTLGFFHEQSRTDRDKHVIIMQYNALDGLLYFYSNCKSLLKNMKEKKP